MIPSEPKKYVDLSKNLFDKLSSSVLIKLDTNIELKKIATINDDPKMAESVIGKYIINSPSNSRPSA